MSEIKRRWPESIDKNGVLSRGRCFIWRGWCVDFIRARGVLPSMTFNAESATYISTLARYEAPRRRLFVASAFGHMLVIGRMR